MTFKATSWVRDPQGGREDSPDGRFVLRSNRTAGLEKYLLEDTDTGAVFRCWTLKGVRSRLRDILTDDIKRAPGPEEEARVIAFLKKFDGGDR